MRFLPKNGPPILMATLCLAGWGGTAQAFRLIEAKDVDGTYCAGWERDCDENVVFTRWFQPPGGNGGLHIHFAVNQDADTDAGSPGLTLLEIEQAAQAAYDAWENVPFSIINFTYSGLTPARLAADGTNTMLFWNADAGDPPCIGYIDNDPFGAIALTFLTEDLPFGEITDTDVVFNPAFTFDRTVNCDEYACSGFEPMPNPVDIQTVMTHEYGHSIGIHHSEFAGPAAARPTMNGCYVCDTGIASGRTLEADDEAAAQCLYPELPTVILIDQTGSMGGAGCTLPRMADAQASANAFVDAFADNLLAVAAFGHGSTGECGGCNPRPGYELLEPFTDNAAALHNAINSTFPCGSTPLWEATCCAIDYAETVEPSNVLVFTDTGENSSGVKPNCGDCVTDEDALAKASAAEDVTVYVLDMTNYLGLAAAGGSIAGLDTRPPDAGTDSETLRTMAERTGGLYFLITSRTHLMQARLAIQEHMIQFGKARQNPPTCNPGPFPINVIQRYTRTCDPDSPYLGQEVTIFGQVTVERGTFDAVTQYVQDCSGGIRVVGAVGPIGELGDSVRVVGQVSTAFGEIRLSPVSQVTVLGPGELPPLPVVDPATGKICEGIGELMTVRGYVGAPLANNRFPLVPSLDTPGLTVFIDPDVGIPPDAINVGQFYFLTGVLSRRLTENELVPRGPSDLVLMGSADVGTGSPPSAQGVSRIETIQPNPFRGETKIGYTTAQHGRVTLSVFDVQGRLVSTLIDAIMPSSSYMTTWDGRNARGVTTPSGVYYLRFTAPDGVFATRRVLLLR